MKLIIADQHGTSAGNPAAHALAPTKFSNSETVRLTGKLRALAQFH
jgi:hypothetical protein